MIFVFFLIIFLSITIPKYFRGLLSFSLGDPAPKSLGRLSLNPLAHVDIFGTILLPLTLLLLTNGVFPIGYAKPLSINPYRYKNPRKGMRLISLSEPITNLLISFFFVIILKLGFPFLNDLLRFTIWVNLVLAIFNLIPIPPLDGANLVASLLPKQLANKFLKIRTFGIAAIAFLFLSGILPFLIKASAQFILKNFFRVQV